MKFSKIITAFFFLFLFKVNISAQDNVLYLSEDKKYFLAAAEALGTNVLVWSVNRLIINEPWTHVTLETWERNLNSRLVYDDDPFQINQFLHPYHGSLYFTSARANNLTFWESVPYTFGGSIIWEYFGETTLPSKNDLIGTTLGGVALGEALFRLSNLVLDESATGSERFWRETAAFFISPIHSFNRIINGRVSKSGKNNKNPFNKISLAIGINNIKEHDPLGNLSSQAYVRFKIDYGNIYRDIPIHKPYSSFSFVIGGNISKDSKIPEVSAQGILMGKNFEISESGKSVLGVFQHYNYIDWNQNQISSHALGIGTQNEFSLHDELSIETSLHVAFTVLGGSNLFFKNSDSSRYNFSNGFNGKADFRLISKTFGTLLLSYYPYSFNIIHPKQGDEFIGVLTGEYNFKFSERYGAGVQYKLYRRSGTYEGNHSISDYTSAMRAFIELTF